MKADAEAAEVQEHAAGQDRLRQRRRHESAQETQALLQAYPELKGIISPTTVGVAAAARVLQQATLCGKVKLTGLGLPSQMRTYIKAGCAKKFGLWDEFELGYVASGSRTDVLAGKLTGKTGQTLHGRQARQADGGRERRE